MDSLGRFIDCSSMVVGQLVVAEEFSRIAPANAPSLSALYWGDRTAETNTCQSTAVRVPAKGDPAKFTVVLAVPSSRPASPSDGVGCERF